LGHRKYLCVSEKVADICCKAVQFFLTNKTKKQLVYLVILMSPKLTNTVVVRVAF
jgi:hypothetical protein